ncbi:MAG: methyl-accepting chemotaxis protein [Clostridiales bacterium]|jgi:methyl-accepting chemotaxis protein|nr:methyl-accepting chemotaxis protein [Clostridiales bacterium]
MPEHPKRGTKKTPRISRQLSLFMLMSILAIASLIGAFSYFSFKERSLSDKAAFAKANAKIIASAINGEKFEGILASKEKDSYWYSVKFLLDTAREASELEYLYIILPNDNDSYMYFAEAEPKDGSVAMDFLETDSKNEFLDETDEIISKGEDAVSEIYDSGSYGMLISGFSVIHGTDGNPLALVGADLTVGDVMAQSNMYLAKLILAILILCAAIIAASILAFQAKISKPLTIISEAFEDLASGSSSLFEAADYGIHELNTLGKSFKRISTSFSTLIGRINELTKEHSAGNTDALIDASNFSGMYADVARSINSMVSDYVQESQEIGESIAAFGNGSFCTPLRQLSGKKQMINAAVDNLRAYLIQINQEINKLTESAIAGNLSTRIDTKRFVGDWRNLAVQLNNFVNIIIHPIEESSEVLRCMSEGNLDARMVGDYKGDFAIIKNSLNSASAEFSAYIGEIKAVLSRMADNDFDQEIKRTYVGQFSDIKESINGIVDKFNQILLNFQSASSRLSNGALRLSESSRQLASSAARQFEIVQMLNVAISDVSRKAAENESNAASANDISAISRENAAKGNDEMLSMLNSMNGIKESSKNIFKVVKVIEDIATQTNLLAINAAVEAAHAGVHGKGFAVVADQVRTLASRSQEAVKNTAKFVGESIDMVNQGTEIAKSTSKSLEAIFSNISDVSSIIRDIADSSKQQSTAIADIMRGLDNITDSIKATSDESIQFSDLSQELRTQAIELKQMIQDFNLKGSPGSSDETEASYFIQNEA